MNKFGQDHYVTGSGRTLTIYKDEIVRQFSLLANRTVRWSAYMENLLLIPQQAMDHFGFAVKIPVAISFVQKTKATCMKKP